MVLLNTFFQALILALSLMMCNMYNNYQFLKGCVKKDIAYGCINTFLVGVYRSCCAQ